MIQTIKERISKLRQQKKRQAFYSAINKHDLLLMLNELEHAYSAGDFEEIKKTAGNLSQLFQQHNIDNEVINVANLIQACELFNITEINSRVKNLLKIKDEI